MKAMDFAEYLTRRTLYFLATLIVTIGLLGSLPSAYASDAFSITVDVDGPDDVPLQEDVTQMGFDTSHLSELDPYWSVFFTFDDVATTSASQTLDGCAFFDADGDGYADFSVCASLASQATGEPARLVSAALYDCKDSENNGDQGSRCPFVGGGGDGSNGIIAQDLNGDGIFESDGEGNLLGQELGSVLETFTVNSPDPFFGDPVHISGNCRFDVPGSCLQYDLGITFKLFVDEFRELAIGREPAGSPAQKPIDQADLTLTNVCSFTSVDPGSERKDCIVNPGSGFIRIIKNVAEGDPDATFDYTLNAESFASITTIGNTGATGSLAVEGDITHALLEVLPDDTWQIDSASCDNGTDLLDANGEQSGLLFVGAGEIVTCTFENSVAFVPAPAIDIIKTAVDSASDTHLWNDTDSDGYPDAGETIDYEFDVQNTGNVDLSSVQVIDALIEMQSALLGNISCPKTTLATDPDLEEPFEGELTTCTASYVLTQADINAGQVDNTATAKGTDPDGTVVEDTDPETVLLPRNPSLTVSKDVDLTNISAPGLLTYSIVVANTGNVDITNVVLTDDLAGAATLESGDTANAGVLDVGETWTYSATYAATQADINAGADLVNTASVVSTEVPGPTTDDATTTITQSASLTVEKSSATTSLDAPGTVTYSYLVTNTGNVTITGLSLSDDNDNDDMSCNANTIAVGGSTSCSATHSFTQAELDAGGTLDNTVTASSNEAPDATDDLSIPITRNPSLAIVKQAIDLGADGALGGTGAGADTLVDSVTINPGDLAAFQITVSNTGNVTSNGTKLVDSLPNPGTDVPDLTWSVHSQIGVSECSISAGTELACGGSSGIDLVPGQGFTVVVHTTIPSDYFTAMLPGGNGELGGNFEIDGNTQLDDSSADPALLDWNLLGALPAYGFKPDTASGQSDDSFGKGSKNDIEPPTVVDGSIPNNKSDLVMMASAAEGVGSDNFVYLAWLRTETLGTANIDFELNQKELTPENLSANQVTPQRIEGDVIVSFDFASGENVVQLSLRTWDGTQWSEPIDLDSTELAQGAVNDPVAFPGVTYPSVNPWALTPPGDPLPDLTFGEAVINATKTFGGALGVCQTFNSFYVKSRSSTSFTAALKDFIAPQVVEIDTCQTIVLDNTAEVSSLTISSISDGATISVTNDLGAE